MSMDDMTADERMVALFPPGYRFELILAGYSKWALAACDTDTKLRLEFLEGLSSLGRDFFNANAMAAVKPCCDTSRLMIEEALRSDGGGERLSKAFAILTGEQVFAELLRLNPSWLRAIKLCSYGGAAKAA